MKVSSRKFTVYAIGFTVANLVGLLLAHASDAGSTAVSKRTLPPSDPALAAELNTIEQQPTIPADSVSLRSGGTFYSAQNLNWPPLPGNTVGVPLWSLGDGVYVLDDLSVDYAALDVQPTNSINARRAMFSPMDGGFQPDDLISGVPYLTIAPTNGNQAVVTIFNNGTPVNYELWWTPVLANPDFPWTALAVGTTGQTNFTVNISTYPAGFFRAIWDTNGIPVWQMADPNNPGIGVLQVFIDSPTNNAVIQ